MVHSNGTQLQICISMFVSQVFYSYVGGPLALVPMLPVVTLDVQSHNKNPGDEASELYLKLKPLHVLKGHAVSTKCRL